MNLNIVASAKRGENLNFNQNETPDSILILVYNVVRSILARCLLEHRKIKDNGQ